MNKPRTHHGFTLFQLVALSGMMVGFFAILAPVFGFILEKGRTDAIRSSFETENLIVDDEDITAIKDAQASASNTLETTTFTITPTAGGEPVSCRGVIKILGEKDYGGRSGYRLLLSTTYTCDNGTTFTRNP